MSQASAVGQIRYTPKYGVYQIMLQCDKGDLFQEYNNDTGALVITNDFASLQPKLSLVIISSRVAEGTVTPTSVDWYFNGTKLAFGSNNLSTNTFGGETGHFKVIPYSAGVNTYYSLQIVKNLVLASNYASCMITAKAKVTVGNTTDEIQSNYSISINKGVSNTKRVTIIAGDSKFFTLTTKGSSCKLKAIAYLGGTEITTGLSYKWYNQVDGAWGLMAAQTSQTLSVADTDVATSGVFKVEVYQGETLIGSDVQSVLDASDPLDIILNPTPEDETISSAGDTVVYTPILVKRGTTTKYMDMLFYFVFMDSAGNILNPATATTAAASGTCTYAMCEQAGGNVNYLISSQK